MATIQNKLAARQAALSQPAIATGIQSSVEGAVAPAPALDSAQITVEEAKSLDTSKLAEGTFLLLQGAQLLMPGGHYKKPNAEGYLIAETPAELARLEHFQKSGFCIKLK